jgi:hypothetical protein
MQKAMQLAAQPLVGSDLAPAAIARAGSLVDQEHARYRVGWGYVALPLLLLTSVFIALRQLPRTRLPAQAGLDPWLTVHQWAGGAFALAAAMHWYYSDRGNNFLHLALVAIVWLVLAAIVLGFRRARGRAGGRLLHTQRWVFLALILLAGMGHFLAPFR